MTQIKKSYSQDHSVAQSVATVRHSNGRSGLIKKSYSQDLSVAQSVATVRHSNARSGTNNNKVCTVTSFCTNDEFEKDEGFEASMMEKYYNNSNTIVDEESDSHISENSRTRCNSSNSSHASSNHSMKELTQYEREDLIPALARRSCHIPGNNVFQDYVQHMFYNNSPIFGICCHNKLHPIGTKMRLWNLFSSIMFGLTVTNCMWLWFFYHDKIHDVNDHHVATINPSAVVFRIKESWHHTRANNSNNDTMLNNATTATTATAALSMYNNETNTTTMTLASSASNFNEDGSNEDGDQGFVHINQGMIFLWTVGCTIHALYDIFIFYLEVCICCSRKHPDTTVYRRTKYQKFGIILVICTTIGCVITATFAILLRASIVGEDDNNNNYSDVNEEEFATTAHRCFNDTTPSIESNTTVGGLNFNISLFNETISSHDIKIQHDASSYEFLLSYCVELILALFLFYPVIETILFTGVLGFGGYIPILGGRPYEIKQCAIRKRVKELKELKQQQKQQQQQDEGSI